MWFYHSVTVHDLTLGHPLSCRQKNKGINVILMGLVRLEGKKIYSNMINVVCNFKSLQPSPIIVTCDASGLASGSPVGNSHERS
jgi:hypothetical protein